MKLFSASQRLHDMNRHKTLEESPEGLSDSITGPDGDVLNLTEVEIITVF